MSRATIKDVADAAGVSIATVSRVLNDRGGASDTARTVRDVAERLGYAPNALARMLEANELGGVGLDVFEHEPAVNPRLLKSSKAVLLPHMGSATLEGRIDMGEKVIINIKTWVDGHNPPDRVLPSML